jgi:hypothetical protein
LEEEVPRLLKFKSADLIQWNFSFYDDFLPHYSTNFIAIKLCRESERKKVFELNPIIYLKLLADHYLFAVPSSPSPLRFSLFATHNVC